MLRGRAKTRVPSQSVLQGWIQVGAAHRISLMRSDDSGLLTTLHRDSSQPVVVPDRNQFLPHHTIQSAVSCNSKDGSPGRAPLTDSLHAVYIMGGFELYGVDCSVNAAGRSTPAMYSFHNSNQAIFWDQRSRHFTKHSIQLMLI